MLAATKQKLQSFFTSSNQFKIPFFQRAYVWKKENWSELWENILEELQEQREGRYSEHFIGTIIVKQTDTGKLGSSLVYDLIDGQQRLTTACLLLKALHDASKDLNLKKYIKDLLIFSDSYGNVNIRLVHSKVDANHFKNIILSGDDNEALPETKSKIIECYAHFKNQIREDIEHDGIRDIVNIILEKLSVIHMALSIDDDVQQIFDTINSLGIKLTTGELLKNYLFSFQNLTQFYEEYWKNIFEADEETIEFWDRNKTSGRVNRATIELFLYSYLVIIKETNVKLESLFKEFKQHLKDKKPDDLLKFAKELSEYALLYQELPDGTELSDISFSDHEKRFFRLINELEINTIFPLVLYIYKEVPNISERVKIITCLESYLVRRTVCKLTTKNYNNLFISIMVDIKKHQTLTAELLLDKLHSYSDDTNRFPDNAEFKRGFINEHLTNKYAKEILYCIALYQYAHEYNDSKRLSSESLSVEHLMPKSWQKHWQFTDNTTKKKEENRDHKIQTLGNLTLIKGRLNSSLKDASWNKKQKGLEPYSTLPITRKYIQWAIWDEDSISERAIDLYNDAIMIWKTGMPDYVIVEKRSVEDFSRKKDIVKNTTKRTGSGTGKNPERASKRVDSQALRKKYVELVNSGIRESEVINNLSAEFRVSKTAVSGHLTYRIGLLKRGEIPYTPLINNTFPEIWYGRDGVRRSGAPYAGEYVLSHIEKHTAEGIARSIEDIPGLIAKENAHKQKVASGKK